MADPRLVADIIDEHAGECPWDKLVATLMQRGYMTESAARALIWHAIALRLASFSPSREHVRTYFGEQ